jgi:predicted peptidase
MENFYYYVSTKSGCDPVKTIFLCVPQEYAYTEELCKKYAEESGWIKQVEEDGSLLIVPCSNDWKNENRDLLVKIYNTKRNSFFAPSGKSIPGRDGIVWTWETLLYLVGYKQGGDYAGDVLVKHPNKFAATALIDGKASDFSFKDSKSDHWLVDNPKDYHLQNKDIPVALWLFNEEDNFQDTLNYFKMTNSVIDMHKTIIDGMETKVYTNSKNNAEEIRVSNCLDDGLASTIMHQFFNHVIRWKNSPDGELKYKMGKNDFYNKDKYKHHNLLIDGNNYHYAVYLPKDIKKEKMPVVFSIHGRGEPTWIFAEKNGWEELADKTNEFIVVFPDSPQNIWNFERDFNVIPKIIDDLNIKYDIDNERIYLSGFSNGAVFTDQVASTYPYLFAAASPWNGPSIEACKNIHNIGSYVFKPEFENGEYEMPFWTVVGDSDNKAGMYREDELEIILKANHCKKENEVILDKDNFYKKENGYKENDRFMTRSFKNEDGVEMVCLTIMKNMPHGAIADESLAAWNFMRKFKRVNKDNKVQLI